MPQENYAIKKARRYLTARFKASFNQESLLPHEIPILLKQVELECFLSAGERVVPIILDDRLLNLLCLPPAHTLPLSVIHYLRESICPVVLYYPWQISNDNFVALKLTIVRNNHSLMITTQLLYPFYHEPDPVITETILHQLQAELPQHHLHAFILCPMPRDGNCLFHAIAYQLKRIKHANQLSYKELRAKAVQYIRQHKNEFIRVIEGDIEEHLAKISQEEYGGGESEIKALAERLQINIQIIQSHSSQPHQYGQDNGPFIYLAYNGVNHYDALVPTEISRQEAPNPLPVLQRIYADEISYVSLSLLIAVAEEANPYQQRVKNWLFKRHAKFYGPFSLAKDILTLVPSLNAYLFYTEQLLTILHIPMVQQHVLNFVPSHSLTWFFDKDAPLRILLRLATLAFIYLQGGFMALVVLPILYLVQKLIAYLTSRTESNFSKMLLPYVFYLGLSSLFTIFNFSRYEVGNDIQQTIIAPRYILYFCENLMKEVMQILLRIPIMIITVFFINKFLNTLDKQMTDAQLTGADPDNEAGALAIAVLVAHPLISWGRDYLPKFEKWAYNQQAEEYLLNELNKNCKENCTLAIFSKTLDRVFQQVFNVNQTLSIEVIRWEESLEEITHCQINISHNQTILCSNYESFCQSQVFTWLGKNTTFSHPSVSFGLPPTAPKIDKNYRGWACH